MEKLDVFGGVEKKQDLLTPEDHRIIKLRKDLIRVSLSENLIFNLGRKDKNGNYSDRNNGLVNFIISCGYDYKQYIRKYLRGLQPFMIVENKRRNQSDFSCIIDASYRIPLWIECYLNNNREQVISFHELNRFDKGFESLFLKQKELLMEPLPDEKNYSIKIGERALFNVEIMRGLELITFELVGIKVSKDLIKVDKEDFNRAIVLYVNNALDRILENNLDNIRHSIDVKEGNRFSFSSYGDDIVNHVSVLLDLYSRKNVYDKYLAAALEIKICELKEDPNYDVYQEFFTRRFKNYLGIDYSGLFGGGQIGQHDGSEGLQSGLPVQ